MGDKIKHAAVGGPTKGICAPCALHESIGRVPGKLGMPIVLVLPRLPGRIKRVN